jgi:hypothetical protein
MLTVTVPAVRFVRATGVQVAVTATELRSGVLGRRPDVILHRGRRRLLGEGGVGGPFLDGVVESDRGEQQPADVDDPEGEDQQEDADDRRLDEGGPLLSLVVPEHHGTVVVVVVVGSSRPM